MKKYFLYFFLFFTISSILIEGNEHSFVSTINKSEVSIIDKFEELSTNFRFQNFEKIETRKRNEFTDDKIICDLTQDVNCISIPTFGKVLYECKIKAHLHLLQLF